MKNKNHNNIPVNMNLEFIGIIFNNSWGGGVNGTFALVSILV